MERVQDILWENVFSEKTEDKVRQYLERHHVHYQEIQEQKKNLRDKAPVLKKVFETDETILLTDEEHKMLRKYLELESRKELLEREYLFYLGQSLMLSYKAMLGKIRRDWSGKRNISEDMLEFLTQIRIDELDQAIRTENKVFQELAYRIAEKEKEIYELPVDAQILQLINEYATALNQQWSLYTDYLYKEGIRDGLNLPEF